MYTHNFVHFTKQIIMYYFSFFIIMNYHNCITFLHDCITFHKINKFHLMSPCNEKYFQISIFSCIYFIPLPTIKPRTLYLHLLSSCYICCFIFITIYKFLWKNSCLDSNAYLLRIYSKYFNLMFKYLI